jgi:biotin transport system substrate-specific component
VIIRNTKEALMQTQTTQPLYDAIFPSRGVLIDGAVVLGAAFFIALCAQVALWVPFSPVPITGQTFGVLLVGALLGGRRGALSVLVYVAEGAAGLPVFAGGGSGLAWLAGPTGGYLLGFVVAAWVVGRLCEQAWSRRVAGAALVMLAGNAVIYLFGLLWLARFVGIDKVLVLGLVPFVPGDLLKIALAVPALPLGWKLTVQTSGRHQG